MTCAKKKNTLLANSRAKVTKNIEIVNEIAEKFLPRLSFYHKCNKSQVEKGRTGLPLPSLLLRNFGKQLLHEVPERSHTANLATLVLGVRAEQGRTE